MTFFKVMLGAALTALAGYTVYRAVEAPGPSGGAPSEERPPGVGNVGQAAYSMSKAADDLGEGEADGAREWVAETGRALRDAAKDLRSPADRERAVGLVADVAAFGTKLARVKKRAATKRLYEDGDALFREVALFDKRVNPQSSWKHMS